MTTIAELTDSLLSQMRTPLLEADPCFEAMIVDAPNILTRAMKEQGYSKVTDIPLVDEGIILLLAQKEVYRRLAVMQAPNFDVEAQYTKILKSQRFDHYMKLVESVQKDIEASGNANAIYSENATVDTYNGSVRNYALAFAQDATLAVSGITSSTVNLDWTLFDTGRGNFARYVVYIGKSAIYDEYEESPIISANVEQTFYVFDFHKNKMRISNLTSGTLYYVVVLYEATNMKKDYFTTTFTTL